MSILGGIPVPNEQGLPCMDQDTAVSSEAKADGQGHEVSESEMEAQIEDMARQLTRHSTHFSTSHAVNPFFEESKESNLHPDSDSFRVKDWIRSLLAAQASDPERFRQRTAGVAFKNLRVHGFGSPTDYQKDVFNAILSIGGVVRKLVSSGMQKVQILHEFNGLVRSGEMLLVLGRPGR